MWGEAVGPLPRCGPGPGSSEEGGRGRGKAEAAAQLQGVGGLPAPACSSLPEPLTSWSPAGGCHCPHPVQGAAGAQREPSGQEGCSSSQGGLHAAHPDHDHAPRGPGRQRAKLFLPPPLPPSVEQLHRVEARGHAPWSVSRASAHSPSQAHWRQAAKRVESGGPGPGHTSPCASLHLVVTFRVMERHLRGGAHLTVPRCVCGGGGSAGPRGSWLSPAVGELSSLASSASPPLCSSFVRQEGSVTPAAPLAPAHEARGSAWRGPGSVAHPAAQPAPQGGLHAGPSHPFQQRRPLVHATPGSPRAVVTASG